MEELVNQIAAKVGIEQEMAQKAVGIILNFLNKSAPQDKMSQLLDAIPGARDVVSGESGGGGMFGGMMGAMAAMNELTGIGLSMGQVQGVTKETVKFAKDKAGEDVINDIVSSIPGLSQFV